MVFFHILLHQRPIGPDPGDMDRPFYGFSLPNQ